MAQAINISLLEDKPTKLLKCTISFWTGLVFKLPRNEILENKNLQNIKYLNYSGIYFLFGKNDENDKNQIYVGQAINRKNGNGVFGRIKEHIVNSNKENTSDSKWYFNEAIIVTTTDNSLGGTELSFLEHYFYNEALKQNRYELMNSNDPTIGNVDEQTENELCNFIDKVKMIIAVLGYKAFEPLYRMEILQKDVEDKEFTYCYKGEIAKAVQTDEGFVLKKGVKIFLVEHEKEHKYVAAKRLQDNNIRNIDSNNILINDVCFTSPSAAAMFFTGGSISGKQCWRDKNGKTIKEIEKEN